MDKAVQPQDDLAARTVRQLYASVDRVPSPGAMRPVHAHGTGAAGTFTPTAVAAQYCRAAHFRSDTDGEIPSRIPVTVRFSNGSGAKARHDGWSDVRGMAVRFHLPDSRSTDLIMMTIPSFFTSTPAQFLDFAIEAAPRPVTRESPWRKFLDYLNLTPPLRDPYPGELSRPDEGAMDYAFKHRFARVGVSQAAAIGAPISYLRAAYFAVHTFVVTGPAPRSEKRWVRFEWQPVEGVRPIDPLSKQDAPLVTQNYLAQEMQDRLAEGPARFLLMMTIGETGDALDDPAQPWPPHRQRIVMGTLSVSRYLGDACEDMSFNPLHLTDGIEASDDPVLAIRRAAYDLSSEWRGATPCPFAKGTP